MTFARIEEIVKANAIEGKYLGYRLHMNPQLADLLFDRFKSTKLEYRSKQYHFFPHTPNLIEGIAIINDVSIINPTVWILVDTTGEEVERGTVVATLCAHGYKLGEPCGICGTGIPVTHNAEQCETELKNCSCMCVPCLASHTKFVKTDGTQAE